jgi:hypothetical protein
MKKKPSKITKPRPLGKHNVGRSGKKKLQKMLKEFNELDVPEDKREIYRALKDPLTALIGELLR